MNHQFYKVTGGKLAAKMNELRDAKVARNKHLLSVIETVGAIECMQYDSGQLAGFRFTNRPPKEVWKKSEGGYMPKRSTTEGRKLQDLIDKVRPAGEYSAALKLFKVPSMVMGAGAGRCGIMMHNSVVSGKFSENVFFIKVPVTDAEPYEPTDSDMVKCEEWEMMKFMSEGKEA